MIRLVGDVVIGWWRVGLISSLPLYHNTWAHSQIEVKTKKKAGLERESERNRERTKKGSEIERVEKREGHTTQESKRKREREKEQFP